MNTLTQKDEIVRKTTVTMPCHFGLHARVAAQFINFARQFCSNIRIRKGQHVADGKSILGLLTLGASWQSELQIEAQGDDANRAIKEIEDYFLDESRCPDNPA